MKRYGFMVWGFFCHFWIDFSCSWFIFQEVAGEAGWYTLLFFYNFFAFALELPLGVLLDRICEKNKGSLKGYSCFRKDMNAVLAPHFKIISPGAAFRFQIGAVHIDPEGRPFAFLQRDHGYADTFVVGVVDLYPARTGTYCRDHGIKPDGIRRETQQSAGIRRE